jgi:hypothetical protein
MAVPAVALPPEDTSYDAPIRRFDLADLTSHAWIVGRLRETYPTLNDRRLVGWLKGIVYSNEHLFLYLPHAVGLAQTLQTVSLEGAPFVQERFVWVEDKKDLAQIKAAARFYDEFHTWCRSKGCEVMFVEENSDVPHEMIKEKLGRVFTRTQQFVRM